MKVFREIAAPCRIIDGFGQKAAYHHMRRRFGILLASHGRVPCMTSQFLYYCASSGLAKRTYDVSKNQQRLGSQTAANP